MFADIHCYIKHRLTCKSKAEDHSSPEIDYNSIIFEIHILNVTIYIKMSKSQIHFARHHVVMFAMPA